MVVLVLPVLGVLHPRLLHSLLVPCTWLFIPVLPQYLTPEEPAAGTSTTSIATAPSPHLAGASGTELTSPPHCFTWERHQRGGLQRGSREAQQGWEERNGSKSLAKSCSVFYQEVKCLEHQHWAREWDSPAP